MKIPIVFQCVCGEMDFVVSDIWVNSENGFVEVFGICLGCETQSSNEFSPQEMIALYNSGGETNIKKQSLN